MIKKHIGYIADVKRALTSFVFCVIIILQIFIVLFCPSSQAAEKSVQTATIPSEKAIEQKARISLTPEEQAWLEAHPDITLGAPTSYPPFVIKRNDGTHVGFVMDYLKEASRILNHRIRPHIEDPWTKVQEKAENGEIDGLAIGGKDSHRSVHFNATDTVLNTYFSVFARSKNEYQIKQFSDLDGMRIGYRVGGVTRNMLEKLPSAELKSYGSNEALTQALLSREIDVVVAWISYDFFRKDKLQSTIDRILLIEDYPAEMVTHIRKDWPELISILNKTIVAMQEKILPQIVNKWFGQWPQQQSMAGTIPLTPEEQAWLDQNHTVRVRVVDYPPYQFINGNKAPQGIVIEYLKLIEERTGIRFKYKVTDQPFAEFLESIKQRQSPDMTALIVATPEREQYLSFTESYLAAPQVIFIREQDKPIMDISGLIEKTIALPRGFVVQEQVSRLYPEIRLALFDSDEGALQAVADGQADAYIGNLTMASYIIYNRGFSNLRVAAAAPFKEQHLSMGNRLDWPELTSIINKALASITEEEKTAIRRKYLAIKYESGIDKTVMLKWIFILGGVAVGTLLIVIAWNRQLSREVNRRKKMELALKQTRDEAEAANMAKSSFLANMSHELRSPLNAILGFSRMLAREQTITAVQKDKLSIINHSGQHLLNMINDVLDLSKIEADRIDLHEETFNLVTLIKEASLMIQSYANEKKLSLNLETEAISFPYIKADINKLHQILNNLLSNAVKYTDKGEVIIRSNTRPIPEKSKRCHVIIEVEDSGQGIEPSMQKKIFDPFVQGNVVSERKGTGLGLSICKRYIEFMGGTIEFESEMGKGSIFRIQLLAEIAESEDIKTPVKNRPTVVGLVSGQPAWRILVVEDNNANRLLLCSLLHEAGFEVREAKNGEEAIDLFEQWQPHFIWMDMRMPVLDGYAATLRIRDLPGGEAVKIVAITASAFKEQIQDILASGCDEVVYKPFRDHEIFETMARQLDITYTYKDRGAVTVQKQQVNLTAEMLAELPPELLQELREATLTMNREAIIPVIERIEPVSLDTAKGLQTLTDNLQIGLICDLLGDDYEE